MINENKLLKKLKRAQILSYIAVVILFAVLILVIAKCSFAGTVDIISPAKIIKPKIMIPYGVARERITAKGYMDIKELQFLISGQIKQRIGISGKSNSKTFVNFNNTKLINILIFIKRIYGFNYKYNRDANFIELNNMETRIFHLPFTSLFNTVSASLGSNQSNGSSGSSMGSGSLTTAASSGSSMGSGSSSSIGGYASEQVSNINTPFFKKFLKTVKETMGKGSSVMFSSRMLTLVVHGPVKRVELVKKYIKQIKKRISKVIFVKLKVINVQLSSGYNYGINWSDLYTDMGRYLGAGASVAVNLANTPASNLNGSDSILFNTGTGTQGVINALNNFGKTNIINQAKLEVLSGQTKSLNNIQVIPYSIGNQITSVGALGSTSQSTPQIGEATSGINVIYTPEVLGDKVYISVQLILNTISGYTQFANGSSVPNVSTQSVSFTISVPNGKSALVGALQYKSNNKNKEGVPILDDIPILGYLFSGAQGQTENNELFLLITPVIIKG